MSTEANSNSLAPTQSREQYPSAVLSSPPPSLVPICRTHYQRTHPFDVRRANSAQLRSKYANQIPVIFEPNQHASAGAGGGNDNSTSAGVASSSQQSVKGSDTSDGRNGGDSGGHHCVSLTHQCIAFKFVLSPDRTVGEATLRVRSRLKLAPSQAIFLLVGEDVMAPTNTRLGDLYEKYRDPDGFLYITYVLENTFG